MKQLRNRETTPRLSIIAQVFLLTDVTVPLSPVPHPARYCTQPEVKFDAFIRLKHGEETIIAIFPQFHTRTALPFDQANKNNSVIYS